MYYLSNGFSPTFLRYPIIGEVHHLDITRISANEAGEILRTNKFRSVYGHKTTAGHLAKYLHIYVPVRRDTIELTKRDTLIVAKASMSREFREDKSKAPKWQFFKVRIARRK